MVHGYHCHNLEGTGTRRDSCLITLLDFTKIRAMRKQNKREVSRASLGNEEEFINPTASTVSSAPSDDHHNHHSPTVSIASADNSFVTLNAYEV
ncbi:hypothetical protein PTKIN_Ptkin07bG0083700 [Pterospermum kingtungense]